MLRYLSPLFLLSLLSLPAPAHFVWIIPGQSGDGTFVRAVFSDRLEPDRPELLQKIAHTAFFLRTAQGKTVAVPSTQEKNVLRLTLPDSTPGAVFGICRYGVTQHGSPEPYLLMYYPKAMVPFPASAATAEPCEQLALEILPMGKPGSPEFQVLWHGKPLAGAEVVVVGAGASKGITLQTDASGRVSAPALPSGLCAVRARHDESQEGDSDGKHYRSVRNYATLVFQTGHETARGQAGDPAATQLLEDARAARALWHHFPGFSADVEVNLDGQVTKGQVRVDSRGKLTVDLPNASAASLVKRVLGSTVAHRLDSGSSTPTPCVFVDSNETHPMGRAIRTVDDEFNSSFRIRDRQVLVVNRSMGNGHFTITVLQNQVNEEKQFLPVCFVVDSWEGKPSALHSSEVQYQTWQRVGGFDLPEQTTVVAANSNELQSRTIRLSHFKLESAGSPSASGASVPRKP